VSQVYRRNFIKKSLLAGSSALLANHSFEENVAGGSGQIFAAPEKLAAAPSRFPDGFIWGMASAAYQGRARGTRMEKANPTGTASRTQPAKSKAQQPLTFLAISITATKKTSRL
jgi:hypothetical protein